MTIIATHSGSFHADDVCGVAILSVILDETPVIIRTRDPKEIQAADFAVDVGGIWDAPAGRFDHHQKGFDGKRESGVVYASSGLVWAAHGIAFLRSVLPSLSDEQAGELHRQVDDELIQHLDMADTGAAAGAPGRFGLSALMNAFNITREEKEIQDALGLTRPTAPEDIKFAQAVKVMQNLLVRVCWHAYNGLRSKAIVLASEQLLKGRILVLSAAGLDWIPVVCARMPDVRFVIYPDSADSQYQVRTVPVAPESFDAKLDLPAAWAGLRDGAFARETGVADAVFCHNARFICGAVSKEGAIALATHALA